MTPDLPESPASPYVAWLAEVEHALDAAHEEAAIQPRDDDADERDDEPHGSEAEPEA